MSARIHRFPTLKGCTLAYQILVYYVHEHVYTVYAHTCIYMHMYMYDMYVTPKAAHFFFENTM